MNSDPVLPSMDERVRLAHSAVAFTLKRGGIPALFIKGPHASDQFAHRSTSSTDVDVLVHPDCLQNALKELSTDGWKILDRAGRPAASHAHVLLHEQFGVYCDLHFVFPGLGLPARLAFANLWARRETTKMAGCEMAVPGVIDHLILLLIHSVRTGPSSETEATLAVENSGAPLSTIVHRAEELGCLPILGCHPLFPGLQAPSLYWRMRTAGASPLTLWIHRVVTAGSPSAIFREMKAALSPRIVSDVSQPSARFRRVGDMLKRDLRLMIALIKR